MQAIGDRRGYWHESVHSWLTRNLLYRFKHFQTFAPWTLGAVMPYEEAVDMLKKSIKKMYGKKARQHCA